MGIRIVMIVLAALAILPGTASAIDTAGMPVALHGGPHLIAKVADLLALHAIAVVVESAPDVTPVQDTLQVRLDQVGAEIHVVITAPGGHSDSRAVSSTDVAADWIESWARRDLLAPLLPMGTALPAFTGFPSVLQPSGISARESVVRAPASWALRSTRAAASLSTSLARDRDATWGAAVAASVMAGPLRLGGEGGVDIGTSNAQQAGAVWSGRLGLSAAWPILLGRVEMRPGVAVAGVLGDRRDWASETVVLCNDAKSCKVLKQEGKVQEGRNGRVFVQSTGKMTDSIRETRKVLATSRTVAPWLAASLAVAVPVGKRLALTLDLAAGASPVAWSIDGPAVADRDPWLVRANLGLEWRWY